MVLSSQSAFSTPSSRIGLVDFLISFLLLCFGKGFIAAFTPLLGCPSKPSLVVWQSLQFTIFSIFIVQTKFPLFKRCLWYHLVVATALMPDHANILFSFQSFKKSSLVGGIYFLHAPKIVFWSSVHAANTHFPGLFNLLFFYILSHWFIASLLSKNPKSAAHIISDFCCSRIEKLHSLETPSSRGNDPSDMGSCERIIVKSMD